MRTEGARAPVVVITGPTAVGKSALALELAARAGGEIVSADSRQVYRFMDIGTAKPTPAERALVPHHVVDVAYPDEPYSVADYQQTGERALADIASRGRPALVVGGSPHYIQALLDRLRLAPRSPALRTWLERADRARPSQLDGWLAALDSASARAIDPRNRRRVIRALEVTLLVGRPFSQAGRRREPSIPATWIGLRRERAALHQRVRARVRGMLDAGWLEEVRLLVAMGYAPTLPSFTATGYADLVGAVRGELRVDEAAERVRLATNAFIRRQETWLRSEPRIQWFDASDSRLVSRVQTVVQATRADSRSSAPGA